MKYSPKPFQKPAINDAVDFLTHAPGGARRFYSSPTGTGKSVMELWIQRAFPHDCWIITPRLEIVAGLLDKGGENVGRLSEKELVALAAEKCITTPVRFKNALLEGQIKRVPTKLIFDEAHHESAESWQDIVTLCGDPPAVGFSATPFRGSARATAKLRKEWGEPVTIITMREAVELGEMSFPTCSVEPLVDDDLIEVSGGEFEVQAANSAVASRLLDVVRVAAPLYTDQWDTPTMFSVGSREIAWSLNSVMNEHELPTMVLTGDTDFAVRKMIFSYVLDRRAALIQINVVSEGVDLPVRRLIDLAPTLSPVKWLQQFGRITRPGGQSYYVCTNRNILRHAYLLDGLLPPEKYAEAASFFPISERSVGRRAVGLEAIGKFRPSPLPLRDGTEGLIYSLSTVDDEGHVTRYAAIVAPTSPDVLWAVREDKRTADPRAPIYGRWKRCEPPNDLSGFASVGSGTVTEKQAAWWKKSAARFGLDPEADVNRRGFEALPILVDIGAKLCN